jgi:hypothetical protein
VGILPCKNIIEEPNSQIENVRSRLSQVASKIGMTVAAFRFLHQKSAKFLSTSCNNFFNVIQYYDESAKQDTYAMNECIFQTKLLSGQSVAGIGIVILFRAISDPFSTPQIIFRLFYYLWNIYIVANPGSIQVSYIL